MFVPVPPGVRLELPLNLNLTLKKKKVNLLRVETPDEKTQAHIALKQTEAGKTLSWSEREIVADSMLTGKIEKLKSPQMREALVEALIGMGVTSDFLAEKIKDGLNADETKFFANNGTVTDARDVVAWGPRHSYLKTALKLLGVEGGKTGVRVNVKNFVYKPSLRGNTEEISIDAPKETVLKRRMAAAKHSARQVPSGDDE